VTSTASALFRWRDTTREQKSALIAAGLGWTLNGFDVMLYSLVVTQLMSEFGMDKATAGLLNALTLVASAIGSLLFGLLADRFGRRRMLAYSIATYSVFTFASGLATSAAMLGAARFLVGLGMGGEWNCGATLVAESWPTERRARAMGLVLSGWAVGYALAATVVGLVLPVGGWRWVFFVGILPVLLALWMKYRVAEPAIWREHARKAPIEREDKRALWRSARPAILALLTMNTFGMFAWWGLFSWLPAYLVLPSSQGGRDFAMFGMTAFLMIINLAGILPGYIFFGMLADRFGRKRSTVLYLAIAALMVPLFAIAREPGLVLLMGCLTAFFGTGFFAGSGVMGSELFPTPIRAAALGLSYNLARGISASAPWVIGTLGETRGLAWAFLACGIAYAAAAASATRVPAPHSAELK
jgi:MFS family permease